MSSHVQGSIPKTGHPGGSPDKRRIFVSHEAEDAPIAEALETSLLSLSHEVECFIARGGSTPHIAFGEEWQTQLEEALAECSALICLLTITSERSTWVAYEIGMARARGLPVFTVLLESDGVAVERHPAGVFQWAGCNAREVGGMLEDLLKTLECRLPTDARLQNETRRFLDSVGAFRDRLPSVAEPEGHLMEFVRRRLAREQANGNFEIDRAKRIGEVRYIPQILDRVCGLKQGDSLLAVCGDKDWDGIHAVYDYMDECVRAAQRGANVHRIYIEPEGHRHPDGFHQREWQVIDCHLRWARAVPNLKVSVLLETAAQTAFQKYCLPEGFGMVIPSTRSREVLVHYGLQHDRRVARSFREVGVVAVFEWIHAELADRASPQADVERRLRALGLQEHPNLEYPG